MIGAVRRCGRAAFGLISRSAFVWDSALQAVRPHAKRPRQCMRAIVQRQDGAAGSGLQLAHLLGQHPQRPVQAHAAVDAADGAGVDAPALHAAARLATAQRVLLHALEGGPRLCGRRDTKRSDWRGGRAGANTPKAFSGPASGVAADQGDDLADVQRTKRSAVIETPVSSSSGRRSRAA